METIIRQVRDLLANERSSIEQLVGHSLGENQQLVIQVVTLDVHTPGAGAASGKGLPDWCNVYEGLTDEQIADLERVMLQRAELTRSAE